MMALEHELPAVATYFIDSRCDLSIQDNVSWTVPFSERIANVYNDSTV
jgi:hypothetical protein